MDYDIASILDSNIVHNKLYYLVIWLGYSSSDYTWELVQNVANALTIVEEFHQQCLDKQDPQSMMTHNTHRLKSGLVA